MSNYCTKLYFRNPEHRIINKIWPHEYIQVCLSWHDVILDNILGSCLMYYDDLKKNISIYFT